MYCFIVSYVIISGIIFGSASAVIPLSYFTDSPDSSILFLALQGTKIFSVIINMQLYNIYKQYIVGIGLQRGWMHQKQIG